MSKCVVCGTPLDSGFCWRCGGDGPPAPQHTPSQAEAVRRAFLAACDTRLEIAERVRLIREAEALIPGVGWKRVADELEAFWVKRSGQPRGNVGEAAEAAARELPF